ncbi:MAG: penicillin acylase family protein [Gemmatimonadetes bacterium]|nr:penicillin acylase family protein [Gemmatimonadota bacterium]
MHSLSRLCRRAVRLAGLAILTAATSTDTSSAQATPDTSGPVIRRTEYGIPHITASSFRGIGIGLGYAMCEDYGERVVRSLLRNKGWMGRTFGPDSVASDWTAALVMQRVQETYHRLDADTRAMYDGYAEGVNRWIRANRATLPAWMEPVFTAHDVAAGDIGTASIVGGQRLVQRRLRADSLRGLPTPPRDEDVEAHAAYSEDGSNAWALAPSRTTSGRAILLRNPHLNWNAGYWEAHVTVPGKLDFYGDFRIGSAFAVIAGFNKDLGWATTNNAPDLDEVYALDIDPADSTRYLFDGTSQPIRTQTASVQVRTPDGSIASQTRSFWTTPLGPVVHRTANTLFIVRAGPDGEYRAGQQFLAMMRARSLKEWKSALAMRARATSNLTYADRAGNILTIWMASLPQIPHAATGDSLFTRARTSADIWTSLLPLDSLPQVLNPRGGYVHNENDPPHFANLKALLDTARYPANVEKGPLDLRSQHALQLIGGTDKLSLAEVIRRKHSMRMLLADRVKPDLLRALAAAPRTPALTQAATLLRRWDNTVSVSSRGSTLFETWWRLYTAAARDSAFAEPWSWSRLTATPRGLGRPDLAVPALVAAIDTVTTRWGSMDVAWGDVHRVRRGSVDVPVGGCSGALGCFRVLGYERAPDGKLVANTGDGWVLAVEFGATRPRAFSILSYGQSTDPASPHHADQAAMFARGEFKPVWWTPAEVRAHTVREYRP